MKHVKQIIRYYSCGAENNGWLGRDVVTVIMDTGVAQHPELNGRLLAFKDFGLSQTEYTWSFSNFCYRINYWYSLYQFPLKHMCFPHTIPSICICNGIWYR